MNCMNWVWVYIFVPRLAEIRPRTEAMVELLGIPYAVEISPCLAHSPRLKIQPLPRSSHRSGSASHILP